MDVSLERLFAAIRSPESGGAGAPLYAVMPVPAYDGTFVGKDSQSHACLLIGTGGYVAGRRPPIRLENLDVQFELRCHVRAGGTPERTGTFTVITCGSLDPETTRYFLSVCETVLRLVGSQPEQHSVAAAVNRLAAMFHKMQKPPTRPVNGLFGELYLLWRSASPVRALMAWRIDETARFDFAEGQARLDVKTSSGRVRAHTCSYDQCNPPDGTTALAASLFVERLPGGLSLRSLIEEIDTAIGGRADLALKLREVVAATLGATLNDALNVTFDVPLADASLLFFDLREVPGIRGPLPPGVSDVHFRSDFSGATPLPVEALVAANPQLCHLLPSLPP